MNLIKLCDKPESDAATRNNTNLKPDSYTNPTSVKWVRMSQVGQTLWKVAV